MQFQGKRMIQTHENGEKFHFGPDLGQLAPNLGRPFFFLSVSRCHGQLSSCAISGKTNDPILRKFSDGRTERQTDESDFIGRCPTNIEGPIILKRKQTNFLFTQGNLNFLLNSPLNFLDLPQGFGRENPSKFLFNITKFFLKDTIKAYFYYRHTLF